MKSESQRRVVTLLQNVAAFIRSTPKNEAERKESAFWLRQFKRRLAR